MQIFWYDDHIGFIRMKLTIEQAIGQKLMLSFAGPRPTPQILAMLKAQQVSGVTLFRSLENTDTPGQVRELSDRLQAAAVKSGQPPLLIGTDQEGGQLMAIGNGTTQFPGNLALGAAGSTELARRVGVAMGYELAAMGVNLNYAPVCDVNSNPQNPAIGTRSFGQDPLAVARLATEMMTGLQEAGIAATAKHFPGHGDTSTDTHYGVAVVPHNQERLRQVELPPFRAVIEAGVKLMLMGHVAVPAFQNGRTVPATLSPQIIKSLLRTELGFTGVTITDAMDMGAIEQGLGLTIDAIASAAAGIDLLLLNVDVDTQKRAHAGLIQATQRDLLAEVDLLDSAERILQLKNWLTEKQQPSLDVVGSPEHQALANEVAAKSITLVKDDRSLLPLRPSAETRLAVIIPQPADLTPADTSSYVECNLATALRRRLPYVTEFTTAHQPTEAEISRLRQQAQNYDLIIVGTLNAYAQDDQAKLVNELLGTNTPLIVVAMRMPYDLNLFPAISTYLCSYSILEPSMDALAQVLCGEISAVGRLPVSIPDLFPAGYRLEP
jgi:beta-N-acetylhexosaminidase